MVNTMKREMSAGRRSQLAITFVNKLLHESGGQITIKDIERLAQPAPNLRKGVGFKRAMIIEIIRIDRAQ